MAVVKVVEMQDNNGNIIHPHTEAKAVFMSDGSTLEENTNENILQEDVRALVNGNYEKGE